MVSVSGNPFVKQTEFDVEFAPSHITKWRSKRTGLAITYIRQATPAVNGYFTVATEIHNNSGCPHTLEHLIFMGSKNYPYKGLLDSLGNRFLSSTNAWTAVDQTVYTLDTTGWEGFKTLLPIYLEHLFYPTLTEEAFLTEVYHIDGKGKEKGVVFSEMLDVEHLPSFIMDFRARQLMFPQLSGYASETGGLTSELRNLTNEEIKRFHKSMYRPDNLGVIITGIVEEEELLDIMAQFDKTLTSLPQVPQPRPFSHSKAQDPAVRAVVQQVEFPDQDESMGEILMAWVGPKLSTDLTFPATSCVLTYFTESAKSILKRNLTEIENPLASEIYHFEENYAHSMNYLQIEGVPSDKLSGVEAIVKDLIQKQTDPENLDLSYMRQVIRKERMRFISSIEMSPSELADIAIKEYIYGSPDGSDLKKWCNCVRDHEELEKWTKEQWCELIETQLVKNKPTSILGKPSAKLNEKIKQEGKDTLKRIKETFGENGLQKFGKKLESARKINDTPIPEKILTQFGKPDLAKINLIETKSYKAGSNTLSTGYSACDEFSDALKKDSPQDFPLFMHFEDNESQYITIDLISTTSKVDPNLLKYMHVFEEIFSFPLKMPNGEYIPYEEVIARLNDDLIKFYLDNNYNHTFSEFVNLKLELEIDNYKSGIAWLYKVMKYSVFEKSRVKVIFEKLLNDLPDIKRSADRMHESLEYRKLYNESSLWRSLDSIENESFFKEVLEKIEDGHFDSIQKDLETLRSQVFNLDKFKVFIVGTTNSIKEPVSSWCEFIDVFDNGKNYHSEPIEKMPRSFKFKSPIGKKCSSDAFIATTPTTGASHLLSYSHIPSNYLDEDLFKVYLASELLAAVEGPFWRGIRGVGLAYGASISTNLETGYLCFSVYRGADSVQAWLTAKKIVDDYSDGVLEFDQVEIENAIAAKINEIVSAESNKRTAANTKIANNVFKQRGPDFTKYLIEKISGLQSQDIKYALNKYLKPLFDSSRSIILASMSSNQAPTFKSFLEKQGYKTVVEEFDTGEEEVSSEDEESDHTTDSDSGTEYDD